MRLALPCVVTLLALTAAVAQAWNGPGADPEHTDEPVVTVSIQPPIVQFGFDPYQEISLGKPSAVAIGDINGDGLDDLVFATSNGSPADTRNLLAIYQRAGNGSLGSPQLVPYPTNGWFRSLRVHDLDGDGAGEIIAGTDFGIAIVRRNGSGGFDTNLTTAPNGASRDLAIADFDFNAVPDVVALNQAKVTVYYGDGLAGVARQASIATIDGHALEIADITKPGSQDLVIRVAPGNGVPALAVYAYLGSDSFAPPTYYGFGKNEWASAMAAADFNSDLRTDVVLSRGIYETGGLPWDLWILNQTRSGTLQTAPYTRSTTERVAALYARDLDQDGRVDLVATHPQSGKLGVLMQQRSQVGSQLSNERLFGIGVKGGVAFGELNNDNCTDAAVVGDRKIVLLAGYACVTP